MVYDGTAYFGFQRQRDHMPTIQQIVENALLQISAIPIKIIGAGRTDTGVHATGQVIAFDIEWHHPVESLLKAINVNLPHDIALQTLQPVADNFHPRFDAQSRTYLYKIYIAPIRHPFRDRYMWHRWQPLALEAMQIALQQLLGEHDFAMFGQAPYGDNTVRNMYKAEMVSIGDEIHIQVEANAFLQHMVRAIVGTLVEIGRGKLSIAQFEAGFLKQDKTSAGALAPPHGLTLTQVTYADVDFR